MLVDAGMIEVLAHGCAVLGSGGGGGVRVATLASQQAFEDCGPVELISLDALNDDDLVMPMGHFGAPTVVEEKVGDGRQGLTLRDRVEELTGRKVAAVMASEVGGGAGIWPFGWAACASLPMVDADGMSRAFSLANQVSMELAGISPSPCVMTDERENISVFHPINGEWLERMCRAAATGFGGSVTTTEYIMTVAEAREATVLGSMSRALQIGASFQATVPLEALLEAAGATLLVAGKIVEIARSGPSGTVRGSFTVEGLHNDSGRLVRIALQNENLLAVEEGELLAAVPDIIAVLDSTAHRVVTTEALRFGQRIAVVSMSAAPVWYTPEGLSLAGPRAFGYDIDHPSLAGDPNAQA